MTISGSKGGGSQRTPYEAPNTLRAKQILHVIYLLTAGPVRGLVDGGKSIYFGEPPIPLIASDGSANFLGIEWEFRDGSPGQDFIRGIPNVETTTPVGITVTKGGGPITQAIDCTNADRVKFTITIPALVTADINTGDQNPTSVSYKVDWRPSGSSGGWNTLYNHTIQGKTTSPFPDSVTVNVPVKQVLEFRMTRLTDDSVSSALANGTSWTSVTAIVDRKLTYPGSALLAMKIDSEQFGSQLPTVTVLLDGILCWVPTNYDPEARTYATSGAGTSGGVWDGTFKRAWTRNPAWVFWTLATDPDWGAGRELGTSIFAGGPGETEVISYVDKWTLYTISQWCDELVDDGFGGQEPRYLFNAYINTQDEAIRVLQSVAQCFRGMVYWGLGQVVPVADMPTDPKKLVTPANVIEGRFEYEGSGLRARHNVVKVRWRDPALNYRENIEIIQDGRSIAVLGTTREIEIDAIGCTSRGQARRVARWILYTEQYENEMVRYRAHRDHADVSPGDILMVQDPARDGVSVSGRLMRATTTTLELDRSVTLLPATSYKVRVQLLDGTISAAYPVLNSAGATDSLSLGDGGIPSGSVPDPNHVWMLIVANAPTYFRVMDVAEDENETYAITALKHRTGKYGYVDTGYFLDDEPWTIFRSATGPMAPPSNINVDEYMMGVGVTSLVRVIVSWTPSPDTRTRIYQVQAIRGGAVVWDSETAQTSVTISDLSPDDYIFQVRARGEGTLASAWVATSTIQVDGTVDPPSNPTGLSASGAIKSIVVSWTNPTVRWLRGVEVWASSNSTFSAGGKIGESTSGSFIHSPLPTETTRYYWVRAVDVFGTYASSWVGPVNATTSFLIAADIQDGILDTAKFAAGIKPTYLIPDTTSSHGRADGDIAVSEASGKLYVRRGGSWEPYIVPLGPGGTLTSDQIDDLDAAKISGEITETQIEDNAISTPKLAAGAVTAGKIAAGAVTTEKLSVGPASGNVIWNSCCAHNRTGWSASSDSGASRSPTAWGAVGTGLDLSDNTWRCEGLGTGGFWRSGILTAGQFCDMYWTNHDAAATAVEAGEWWEFQAMVQAHRCSLELKIIWQTALGAYIGEDLIATTTPYTDISGRLLARYKPLWGKAQAPATAARAFAAIRMIGESGFGSATGTDPYIFFTRAQLALASASQTEPKPWGPGGVTEINGGMIRTESIVAGNIAAGAITTDKIAANAVTAGTIAAGAVRASEIETGEIRAYHLASEEIIANTVQVKNLIIGTQKITSFGVSQMREAHTYNSWNVPPRNSFNGTTYETDPSVTDVWNAYFDIPPEGTNDAGRQGSVWVVIWPYGDLNLGLTFDFIPISEGGGGGGYVNGGAQAEWILDGSPMPISTPIPLSADDNTSTWHTISLRVRNYSPGWYWTPARSFGWRLLMFRR